MGEIIAIIPVDPNDRLPEVRAVPYEPAPSMTPHPCEWCGVKGWLGVKQRAKKAECPEMNIVCMNCVFKQVAAGDLKLGEVKNLGGK